MSEKLSFAARIALELPELEVSRIARALGLFADGGTVPFIARYRKEQTGGLDEVALRAIEAARDRVTELDKRRDAIRAALLADGVLTDELASALTACTSRTALEDLYAPFRKKRKTRASVARERGLEPVAALILRQARDEVAVRAGRFVRAGVEGLETLEAVLQGARDIVAEVVTERADLRAVGRRAWEQQARLVSQRSRGGKGDEDRVFEHYFDHGERASAAPSHRVLAILRGEAAGALKVRFELDDARLVGELVRRAGAEPRSPWHGELVLAVEEGYRRLLRPQLETELRGALKARADSEAVGVFARNIEGLLMAAPLGPEAVLGLDPGFRTGVKAAMVAATGEVVMCETLFMHRGEREKVAAEAALGQLIGRFRPRAVAIGNGTAGRETEASVRAVVAGLGHEARPVVVSVSEAGASVYSASELARAELPGLDVTYRGAVSIARRLQDPLAELVKVEPKALGVGQYQHDVDQRLLEGRLGAVVEDVVHRVGVDVNTASPALLGHVVGIGPQLAQRIVQVREDQGGFKSRAALRGVPGLGPKRFEQAAGFLRVRAGDEPLDASGVHPERYALVERIARDLKRTVKELIGGEITIDLSKYVNDDVGLPTLRDIAEELAKPGRDPRASFVAPAFREDVRGIEDLQAGMELAGVVTNVTAFGAFVDIGVHQDGLIHISKLANHFVRDPHAVVAPGDVVRVQVIEVDRARRRIALARLFD